MIQADKTNTTGFLLLEAGFLKVQILDGDYNRDSLHSALMSQKQVWAGMERSKVLFKHWRLFPASPLDDVTRKPHLEIKFCITAYLTGVLLHTYLVCSELQSFSHICLCHLVLPACNCHQFYSWKKTGIQTDTCAVCSQWRYSQPKKP